MLTVSDPIRFAHLLVKLKSGSDLFYRDNDQFYPWARSVYLVPEFGNNPRGFTLGKGRELWTGAFGAVKICQGDRPGTWKPLLNMDCKFISKVPFERKPKHG